MAEDVADEILEHLPADALPYLIAMIVDHDLQPGYDDSSEFGSGLDLILDALDQADPRCPLAGSRSKQDPET
jgi:hypothetical protein